MPVYDFKCPSCGAREENKLTKHGEIRLCRECGHSMDREFPKPAFQVIGGEYRKVKM